MHILEGREDAAGKKENFWAENFRPKI